MHIDIEKIPESGYIFAYFQEKIIFEPYVKENDEIRFQGCNDLNWNTLEKCHCFDEKTEYRLFFSGRQRKKKELLLTSDMENASSLLPKEERVLLKQSYSPDPKKRYALRVINYYKFTEFDNMYVVNYRLAGVNELN